MQARGGKWRAYRGLYSAMIQTGTRARQRSSRNSVADAIDLGGTTWHDMATVVGDRTVFAPKELPQLCYKMSFTSQRQLCKHMRASSSWGVGLVPNPPQEECKEKRPPTRTHAHSLVNAKDHDEHLYLRCYLYSLVVAKREREIVRRKQSSFRRKNELSAGCVTSIWRLLLPLKGQSTDFGAAAAVV
ncbi:hypothetical protein Ae201684P_011609 [Aphanomyces euteiches]|nr:hypothetical protein Ae201684P_011609 [Aphanomyces euteiches]